MSIEDSTQLGPAPIEMEPRPCENCGLTIDLHDMVDDGDGPEFFCRIDETEREIFLGAAELVRRWEMADSRDAWRHTGVAPPPSRVRSGEISVRPAASPLPYSTPQSTIDAFWCVVSRNDSEYLARWLAQRPLDVKTLQKLWEGKHARI